jgi:hypothetical protein
MKVHIEGVGHRSNTSLYELEGATEEFLTEVRRSLFKLEHEEGDGRLKISFDINVEYEKPMEVKGR